jgi:hypothetical protein
MLPKTKTPNPQLKAMHDAMAPNWLALHHRSKVGLTDQQILDLLWAEFITDRREHIAVRLHTWMDTSRCKAEERELMTAMQGKVKGVKAFDDHALLAAIRTQDLRNALTRLRNLQASRKSGEREFVLARCKPSIPRKFDHAPDGA